MKIELKDFKIDRDNVLRAMKCAPESPVYTKICVELEKVISEIDPKPSVYIAEDGLRLYVLISAGRAVSDYSKQLMDKGECLGGLVADTLGDEVLFSADSFASRYIREYLATKALGVSKRLEAPDGIPLKLHKDMIEKTGAAEISLTDAYMFDPPKTMAYVLELTEDKSIFKAQHDCSKCPNINCPRRTVQTESMDAVAEHGETQYQGIHDILCIDIGTTTIAFERINNGERKVITAVNRQRQFGADVISRIEASNAGRGKELKRQISYQLIEGLNSLYKGGAQPEKIIISANTVMVQLLMGYSCENLGKYPFKAENTDTIETDFKTLVSGGACDSPVTILPAISGFVGGDIVSGMYMCDFDISDRINLFIDLGTNGEMAIGNSSRILVSSTAAGPAFEGGRISCGTGSVDGAVYAVDLGANEIKTINNKPAVGLCGTGIVELAAELLKAGTIDSNGLLADNYFEKGYPLTNKIYFTQKDIREIQTAKAAVRAGIELLIKRYGCSYDDISSVYIAGGFGYRLNIKKACEIGLIPERLEKKCIAIGNSSLGGAVKYGFGADGKNRTEKLRSICSELTLALDDEFNESYINYMGF